MHLFVLVRTNEAYKFDGGNVKKLFILLGPPGSGKGTQARRVSQEQAVPHISTGDLFREHLSKNSALGKRAKAFMEAGQLVPDELVLEMLFHRVAEADCKNGYLLDGFPRTIPQAEALDRSLPENVKIAAFNLKVSDEIIVKRAEGRLTCSKCGRIYNRYFSPPAQEGVCDKCCGHLFQRDDDKSEVVNKRLKVYHEQTAPLIDFYKKKNVLTEINGEETPDQVFNALMKVASAL